MLKLSIGNSESQQGKEERKDESVGHWNRRLRRDSPSNSLADRSKRIGKSGRSGLCCLSKQLGKVSVGLQASAGAKLRRLLGHARNRTSGRSDKHVTTPHVVARAQAWVPGWPFQIHSLACTEGNSSLRLYLWNHQRQSPSWRKKCRFTAS